MAPNPGWRILGQQQWLISVLATALIGTGLAAAGLAWFVVVKYTTPAPVYLWSGGGPGLVRPGYVDDVSAVDYATRWLEERWNWRPETYKRRQETILAATHESYTTALRAEMEKDGRLIRDSKVSSQLVVLHAAVTKRKDSVILVTLDASRFLTVGTDTLPAEEVQATVIVVPMLIKGLPKALMAAGGTTEPPLRVAKR